MSPTPYYEDDSCVIYHGDCREIRAWLEADVLVTDPPYGIGWTQDLSGYSFRGYPRTADKDHHGIQNDEDTSARDQVLTLWGGGTGARIRLAAACTTSQLETRSDVAQAGRRGPHRLMASLAAGH